jgi:hypothetical protein
MNIPRLLPYIQFRKIFDTLSYYILLVELNWSAYWLWISVEQLKLHWGFFAWIVPGCSSRLQIEKMLTIHHVLLIKLNRSVYCLWKSVQRLKTQCTGGISAWIVPGCSHRFKFEKFWPFIMFYSSSWIDRYIVCENRLNGWKVIKQVVLAGNLFEGVLLELIPHNMLPRAKLRLVSSNNRVLLAKLDTSKTSLWKSVFMNVPFRPAVLKQRYQNWIKLWTRW